MTGQPETSALLEAARHALTQGREPLAIELLVRTLVMVPDLSQALGALALLHSGARRTTLLNRAAVLAPTGFLLFSHAAALQADGRLDEAETVFRRASLVRWRENGARIAASSAQDRIGIGWKPGFDSGWGVYGANLVARLEERGDAAPVIVNPAIIAPGPIEPAFAALYDRSQEIVGAASAAGGTVAFTCLAALGNEMIAFPKLVDSKREIGVIFLEYTALSAAALERGRHYDKLIAGSKWGAEILRKAGYSAVETVLQGIDPHRFHFRPRPARGPVFRIFSGGKLEFRKGQDIVIETFRRFHRRHPDSRLIAAWQSPWPEVAASITWAGIVPRGPSRGSDQHLAITPWLASLGLPEHAVEIVDLIPNHQMAEIVASADCAIFPNRCEGGTNLVAMEAMALGVPTILSANTGHLDLIEDGNCLALARQSPIGVALPRGGDGWGESDIEEAVDHLETLYQDKARADAIGAAGAASLARLAWPDQIDRLMIAIGPLA